MDISKCSAIVMRLAAALLLLVLLSTGIVTGRYARYTTTATGTAAASVARFSVSESGDLFTKSIPLQMIPGKGNSTKTEITVENDSEVAVSYTVDAENPFENFPLAFRIHHNGTAHGLPFTVSMAPGASADLILETIWTGEADASYSGQVDLIQITFAAVQID